MKPKGNREVTWEHGESQENYEQWLQDKLAQAPEEIAEFMEEEYHRTASDSQKLGLLAFLDIFGIQNLTAFTMTFISAMKSCSFGSSDEEWECLCSYRQDRGTTCLTAKPSLRSISANKFDC